MAAITGFLDRHYFVLRRLHSLTGIVPIGLFLIVHLTTNSSLAWGAIAQNVDGTWLQRSVAYFQKEVYFIHDIPHLLLIEIALWVSIGFHAGLGVYYARSGRPNTQRYPHQDNWRYTLQRWSGYIGIVFIFYHVATLRWGWTWLVPGRTVWSSEFAASTLAAALQGSPEGFTFLGVLVSLLYFAGVTLLVFHFANGLWTAAITWGLTVSEAAQRRWGYVCLVLGVGLMGMGWAALGAALVIDHDEARVVEQRMLDATPSPGDRPPDGPVVRNGERSP